MAKIVREGFFFRAVNEATGFRSMLVGSASQAGMIIKRKFGNKAFEEAFALFVAEMK